ncbi:thioesterase domain-containing protein [Amycolatopsis sp. NPDC051371]|uniref:thioesterase II family protein n=1 Tax=Amycolatopsis sp. NPDC051371 TaxID=3155800 RepID=UPI0034293624
MPSAIRLLSPGNKAMESGYRYLCLPPAGDTVGVFRDVAGAATAEIWGAEYPGRGDRWETPLPASLEQLAEQLTAEVLTRFVPGRVLRTVVAGFSMGAFLAVELAQRLHTHACVAPAAIVVVGAPAPQKRVCGRYPQLGEATLAEVLGSEGFVRGLGNRASFEVWAYAKDLLRRDIELTTAYRGPADAARRCPLATLCGEADPVETEDATVAWRTWTIGPFLAATVPESHLELLAPGRGEQFWAWMRRIEQDVVAAGVRDAGPAAFRSGGRPRRARGGLAGAVRAAGTRVPGPHGPGCRRPRVALRRPATREWPAGRRPV